MFKDDFIKAVKHLDFIDESVLTLLARNDAGLCNQVSRWTREGILQRISKGRYVLSRERFGANISNEALACRMVPDTYVSCQSALAMELMIPESYTGRSVTCVTWRKPRTFESTVGTFRYRHIKRKAYEGFHETKDEYGKVYRRANPVKALLDHLYFDTAGIAPSLDYLEDGLRLQKMEKLRTDLLKHYLGVFSDKVDRWIDCVLTFRKEARK